MAWWLLPLTVLWLALAVRDLRAVAALRELPRRRDGAPPADVTVVMAVRDDAPHVESSVRNLLAQQHTALRVVVVDDRSSDDTGAILARLAASDPRLDVRTVRALPDGWLGKTHALHVGAADVASRWLLFTDGDAQLGADTLARAIDAAEAAGAHHVALLPDHRRTSLAGRACLLAFVLTVLRRVVAVNGPRPRSFVGTGAFNLVRTDAYREVGGHDALRLEVVDDVWLGYLLARAGRRSRVWLARRDLAIDWGGTPRELLRVTTKNMFAVLRFRTWLAALALAVLAALLGATFAAPWLARGGPAAAPWSGAVWRWLPLAAYAATAAPAIALARRMGWPVIAGVLAPLGRLLLPIALANSTWTTLRQGGVRWRGTFYPLAQLRAGQVSHCAASHRERGARG